MSLRSRITAIAAAFAVSLSIVPTASAHTYFTPAPSLGSLEDNIGEYTPSRSYDRDLFGSWIAVSNPNAVGWDSSRYPSCNVREAALIDAGNNVVVGNSCKIVSGQWSDPYVAKPTAISDSSRLDLDHVVPLAHAWRSGAAALPSDKLRQIANDKDNLILTSATENRSKGDQAIDSWFPQRNSVAYCDYAAKYATVVDRYDLTIDQEEYDQLDRMYGECGFSEVVPAPPVTSSLSSW